MNEKTLDIDELIYTLKKRYKLILIITLFTTLCGVYTAVFRLQPSYQASAKIFAGKEENIQSAYSTSDLATYRDMLNAYVEVIKTDDFLNSVLKKIGVDKSAAQVKGGLGFTPSSSAPILEISYRSSNPEDAKMIVEGISTEFGEQVQEIIINTYTRVIESVKVRTILPNKSKVIIVAFMAGLLLSLGIVFVLDYLDNTIKTKEDLEKISLDIPVIGIIPHGDEI